MDDEENFDYEFEEEEEEVEEDTKPNDCDDDMFLLVNFSNFFSKIEIFYY